MIRKLIAAGPPALAILLFSSLAGRTMELTSPDITRGARLSLSQVNTRCGGQNRSPTLRWSGVPSGTRSFAVTLFDPDAGGGTGFWHWLVLDIPAGTTALPQDAGSGNGMPPGVMQSPNDFGEAAFGGACPPPGSGIHHYQFTLYALAAAHVPSGVDANGASLATYLKAHALAMASLTATYSR